MFKGRKKLVSYSPLYASLIVIVTMASFIGVYWSIEKYFAYNQAISKIHLKYNESNRKRLVEEMDNVAEFIEYKKLQADKRIEEELQQKVHIAYVTASHLYSLYKNSLPLDEIRSMVIEALRPIRWDINLGYYFVGNINDGTIELQADRPSIEGTKMLGFASGDGEYYVREMVELVQTKGAGLLHYRWTKPEKGDEEYDKVSFIRGFKPFGWFLGAGLYVDDMERRIQQDVLERVREIQFSERGVVTCIRGDGVTLIDFDEQKNGRQVKDIKDSAGSNFGEKIFDLSKSKKRNGFVNSIFERSDSETLGHRLSYVQYFEDWDWIFVTSMYEDEMFTAIEEESVKYRNGIFRDIIIFMIIFSLTVCLVLVIAYYYSLRIKRAIDLFTDFFRDAADKKIKLEEADLTFHEFVNLGKFANEMVDDRIRKELLIKRDELRLDTLFNLSMMQYHTLQEICGFTLERSLKITQSEFGYIALVTKDDNLQIVSLGKLDNKGFLRLDVEENDIIDKLKHSYRALASGVAVFSKVLSKNDHLQVFKKNGLVIQQLLDVPVLDGNEVVAVVGVCNKTEPYEDSDVRQLSILQEAMWHQLLKTKSEKELIRLRNLLKSINDSMPSVIIGVDDDGKVMQWNRKAELMTSISASDAEGKNLVLLYPRFSEYLSTIKGVIASGIHQELKNTSWEFDGEKRFENISIFPLIAEQVSGAVIRIDDVTEKIRLEDMMVQSEKMLSVGGLAAGMAHEINNPLAGILQNIQVVQKRLDSSFGKNIEVAEDNDISIDDISRYIEQRGINGMLDAISQSAKRAAALVLNMLSFSRKSDSIFSSIDVGEMMDKTLELVSNDYDLKKKYDFKQIKITKDYAADIPLIPCEGTNIQQVFLNILKNGAYAISEKDYGDDIPEILININVEMDFLRIEIEDNGPGIDEKKKKRIFEPFYTTKPVGVGTGLGLSISYFIIHEQHRGELEVLSKIGEGAKFIVRLPISRDKLS